MAEQTAREPKRFKIRHLFLGLLLLLLVWFALFRISAHRNVTRRLGQLRAQGYPMSLAQLGQRYTLAPGADNAADYYMTAFSHYEAWNDEAREGLPWVGRGQRPTRTGVMEPEIAERAERFLADNEKTLSLLHEAVAIESSRYPIDFEEEIGAGVSWLGDVRKHAFLLSLEALAACERGDPNQALASVQATLALARSLNTPILIHRLVNIAVQALAYRSSEHIVNRVSLTDEQLRVLSNWLEAADDSQGQRDALIGERCFGVDIFQGSTGHLAAHFGGSGKLMTLVVIPRRLLGLHDRDLLGYLDLMEGYIDAAKLPPCERLAQCESLRKARPQGLLTRELTPAFVRVFQLEIRHVAHRRAAQAALAIERYRLAEGGIPLALSDLVPTYLDAVPVDPFDGQNLRYRLREETGYVVYSVGEDLTDDGGTEHDERKRNADNEIIWDVTFIVER